MTQASNLARLLNSSGKVATANQPTGAVLQVVEAEFTTPGATTSTSYVDTGISLSITPSSVNSKILLVARVPIRVVGYTYGSIQWVRNSTVIYTPPSSYEFGVTTTNADIRTILPYMFMDSPGSTAAVTYKAQIASYSASATSVEWVPIGHRAVLTLMEIAG